ncbi:NUDIX domain-containing protein [Glycomyces buryatensis]|uniref:NUDIX domain-containing protein n=1 Tax=Glycomyces buryatensis TaxID=2570927 RepID=A0A4S8Q0K3_9ACTN|nr:NUDIX domain-containing protein [Glycomyces buryatensis]THV37617.1 NUDIX domain-containing protein [Glycomyces buryatensis]
MSENHEHSQESSFWQEAAGGPVDVRRLTSGRPFCAGVLIVREGRLLVTLSAEDISAAEASGTDWNVGGVGGGQEPGEEVWDCAAREGFEELGVQVRLLSSPRTYLHDIDGDLLRRSRSDDRPAPFMLQRQRNADAATPYKPGLPAGPFTYLCMFAAELAEEPASFKPDDPDIAALVWMPLSDWGVLDKAPTFARLSELGATIAAGGPIAEDARVHLPSAETLRVAGPLLARGFEG